MRKSATHLKDVSRLFNVELGNSSRSRWNSQVQVLLNAFPQPRKPTHRRSDMATRSMSTAALCETPRRQPLNKLHGSLSVFNLTDRVEISDLDHTIRTRQADKSWTLFTTVAARDDELIPLSICYSLYALLNFAKKLGGSGKVSQQRQHQLDQLLNYVHHNHNQHQSTKDFLAFVQDIPLPAYKKLKREIRFGCRQSAWKLFFHMHKRDPESASKLSRNTCLDLMLLLMEDKTINENQLKKRLELVALYGAGKKMVDSGRSRYLSAADMLRMAQICYAYKENQSPDSLIDDYVNGLKKKKLKFRGDSLDELIWRLIDNNDLAKARDILDKLKNAEGVQVGESVYVNMMGAYRRQRRYHDALVMFEHLLESNQKPTIKVFTAVLQIFAEQGATTSAERASYIFDSMIRLGVKPDVSTYTEMIRVYAGNLKMCQQLYNKMQQHHIKPNVYTYNALIESASKKRDVKSVLRWFQAMVQEEVQPNQVIISNVLRSLSAQYKHYPNVSEAILQIASQAAMAGIKADAALYTILLKMQAETVGIEGALDIHREMLSHSVEPNAYTYTILIHTCGNNKIPDTAQQIFDLMRQSKRHAPNTVTFTALMNVWQKAQKKDKVNQLSLEFLKACKSDRTGRFWIDKKIRDFIRSKPCSCES